MDNLKFSILTTEKIEVSVGKGLFKSKIERFFPVEIQFYDNYLMIYREKYYNKKSYRREYNRIFYKDINEIAFDPHEKWIAIGGKDLETTYYVFNKDGSLPQSPTLHKMSYDTCFVTPFNDNDKRCLIEELEKVTNLELNVLS